MFHAFISVALLFLSTSIHAESCNYATFSVKTLYPTINVGTFSLSTNRCQALKASLGFQDGFLGLGFKLPFDGSLRLECESTYADNYRLAVKLYSDPLCNDLINEDSDGIYVDLTDNNKFTIYDALQFSLDEMSCDADISSCGVSIEMGKNCSWSESERYVNISVPDAHCISLAPDFGSILSKIPFEILPEEMVDDLETSSMNFRCCSDDNSLLISNYSDTSCSSATYGRFRISSAFNGECFVIGNEDDIVEEDSEREDVWEDEDDSYVFILKWECNAFEFGCDIINIPILDESMLPQTCSDTCMEIEKEIEAIGSKSQESANTKKHRVVGVIVAVVSIIVFLVLVILGGMIYQRQKMNASSAQRNMAVNIGGGKSAQLVSDDKYSAFVSVSEDIGDTEMPNDTVQ